MTIAYVNSGTFAAGTTSAAPGVPSSPAAGNRFVAFVGSKPFNATVGTPSNYTKLATSTSGTEVVGNGTGSCFCVAFDHSVTGSESGTVSFTVTTGDPAMARIHQFSKSSSMAWDVAATALADTNNAGNNLISATGSAIDIQSGDMLVFACPMPNDNDLIASPVMTVPGCTVGSVTQIATDVTTVGNDSAIFYYRAYITAGASTGAPVFTAVTGPLAGGGSDPDDAAVPLVRLREVAPERGPIVSMIPHFTSSFGGSVTAATSVTGDIASTIPHFGSSLAGTSKNLGSVASTTPSFGGTLAGTNDDVGTLGVTVPSFGSAFEGDTKDLGSVATTMPSFTSAVDGTVADVSTIDATMPRFGSALEGTVTNVGSMATTMPSFGAALVGDELIPVEAEVEIWMPHFGTALQGYSPPTAQLEITMPSFGSMIVGEGGGEPMPEASGGGGYWDLIAILSNAARIAEQDLARLDATPTDCPKCGTILKASRGGVRFCPFDGWKQTDGYHIENPG